MLFMVVDLIIPLLIVLLETPMEELRVHELLEECGKIRPETHSYADV